MNPTITTAIRQMSEVSIVNDGNSAVYTWNPAIVNVNIPTNSIHIYYESEQAARQESFRTGQPFFISVINGVRVYSVRVKL